MKLIILLLITFCCIELNAQNFNLNTNSNKLQATSVGIIIYSNDNETVYNALRFANYSKNEGDTVCVFLLGKGVELEKLSEQDKDIKEQVDNLLDNGGEILGCGTCLQSRNSKEPKVCKFSSMKDLYDLVRRNNIVLTF